MKRCLPMPQRYAKDHTDTKDRVNNLERRDGGDCGYQRADCGDDMNSGHYYRFEEDSGNFQDEIGSADLVETGTGTALTRHAEGVSDTYAIEFPSLGGPNWGTPYGGTEPKFPRYPSGLFNMGSGASFAIGLHVWLSSTHPSVATEDDAWVPLVGQGSGETASGESEGMLWWNWHTKQIGVVFSKYEFHTADNAGAPRHQLLGGPGSAVGFGPNVHKSEFLDPDNLITEDAWNKILWVHDDAANRERLYVNSATEYTDGDFPAVGIDAGLVTTNAFTVGQYQYAHGFLAQFFGVDLLRWLGAGSRVDNVAVWPSSMPTAGERQQFMNGTGNLSENGTWVVVSGHDVARTRIKVNGT